MSAQQIEYALQMAGVSEVKYLQQATTTQGDLFDIYCDSCKRCLDLSAIFTTYFDSDHTSEVNSQVNEMLNKRGANRCFHAAECSVGRVCTASGWCTDAAFVGGIKQQEKSSSTGTLESAPSEAPHRQLLLSPITQ